MAYPRALQHSIAVRRLGPHPSANKLSSGVSLRLKEACPSAFRLWERSNMQQSIERGAEARNRVQAPRPAASKSRAHSAWAARHECPALGLLAFANQMEPKRDSRDASGGARLPEARK